MSFPTAGDSRPPRGFRAGVAIGILITLVVGLTAAVIVLAQDNDGDDTKAAPAASSASPTSPATPTLTPTPVPPPGQLTAAFGRRGWVKGERLWFQTVDFDPDTEGCLIHAYKVRTKNLGAFESDCRSWESDGYDILLFYVAIRNPTGRAVTFNLRNFVLTARDTRTFGPVNVRSKAEFPPNFLPETGRVPPRSNLVGYLTFDGRVENMVPARLSYVAGTQTLTIVFKGPHSVV